MEELGPPSAARSQSEPQERRERASLQKALQVQRLGNPMGQMLVGEGIKDSLSVLCSYL